MSDFSFSHDVDVRYRDLDTLGHVNNAVYATYVESARLAYLRTVLGEAFVAGEVVIAHLSMDFRRSLTLDDDVVVAVRVSSLGETSVGMDYEVRAGGDVAATAETVLVTLEDGDPAPLPGEWRRAIEAFEGGVDGD